MSMTCPARSSNPLAATTSSSLWSNAGCGRHRSPGVGSTVKVVGSAGAERGWLHGEVGSKGRSSTGCSSLSCRRSGAVWRPEQAAEESVSLSPALSSSQPKPSPFAVKIVAIAQTRRPLKPRLRSNLGVGSGKHPCPHCRASTWRSTLGEMRENSPRRVVRACGTGQLANTAAAPPPLTERKLETQLEAY